MKAAAEAVISGIATDLNAQFQLLRGGPYTTHTQLHTGYPQFLWITIERFMQWDRKVTHSRGDLRLYKRLEIVLCDNVTYYD